MTLTKYRWECPGCRSARRKAWHGRWYNDGNLAQVMGERHADRECRSEADTRHVPYIVDSRGRSHGRV